MTLARVPLALVGWLGLVAAWMTWAPFEFRRAWPPLQLLLRFEPETVGHFFLLMPFGMIAAACLRDLDGRWNWRPLAVVGVAGFLLELGQGWIVGRSLSPHDVLVGYLGAALAIGATVRFLRRGGTAEAVSRALAVATILLVWGLMIHGAVEANRGMRLAGWSAAFPLEVAQELGGLRPYLGQVDEAVICAGKAYEVCAQPGADAASRAGLARAAMDSQRVRLTARVVSESDAQDGPVRILTFSDGAYLRNATLAQRNRTLILRLRTPRGGPNGTSLEFALDEAVRAGESTRLTATFAEGVVTLRAGSDARTIAGVSRPPFRNSLRMQGLGRPRLPQPLKGRAPLVGTVVQFLGLGLGLGYRVRSRATRMIVAPAIAVVFLALLDAVLGHTLSPTPGDVALAALAATLAAITVRGHFRDPVTRDRPGRPGGD